MTANKADNTGIIFILIWSCFIQSFICNSNVNLNIYNFIQYWKVIQGHIGNLQIKQFSLFFWKATQSKHISTLFLNIFDILLPPVRSSRFTSWKKVHNTFLILFLYITGKKWVIKVWYLIWGNYVSISDLHKYFVNIPNSLI